MNPTIQLKQTTSVFLVALLLTCFAIPWIAQAVVPAPDGGYPGDNTAEGNNALFNLTSGINNTAVGAGALHDNTTGGYNVAIGSRALFNNTTGSFNMAVGTQALTNNTASYNLAIGYRVGFMNTTGNHLTGIGAGALLSNTSGSFNTAIGADALNNNNIGHDNTATGNAALLSNTTAVNNTATGSRALLSNTSGSFNTAIGASALFRNTTASFNVAVGVSALANSTGGENTAIGRAALFHNTSGSQNIALGVNAGLNLITGDNNIEIGNAGAADDSDTIRIGATQDRTFIAGIRGTQPPVGVILPVLIDVNGQLGTTISSRRFKHEIKPIDKESEAILALKPVTFHYKSDQTNTPQFGLVAEEVAEVNPDLVVRDKNGEVYTVRYEAVNAMLLNEFLKEHKTVQEQGAAITLQRKDFEAAIAQQQKQIEMLTAALQKVSAQLELSKAAPQTARMLSMGRRAPNGQK
jgi:Chaperone of endosialidase